MKNFVYIIGNTDDFESLEELKNAYFDAGGTRSSRWTPSVFEFDLPMNCSNEIAVLVGRGMAFSNDWCMDGTFSTLLEA